MEYKELPKPVPAAEAIRESDVEIRVPDGTELTIGPFERQYAHAFRIARIDTFKDLHTLGFVHREVREDQVTQAYRLDERAFRDATLGRSAAVRSSCGCGGHRPEPNPLARRHFQNHLIDLLQSSFGQTLSADHPAVLHTFKHVKSWLSMGPHVVGVFALADIVIGDRATLTNTPTVKALHARDITIGKEGRLRFLSGSVKVRCRNLNGPPTAFYEKVVPGLAQEFLRRLS
jgi:hypothetical protein